MKMKRRAGFVSNSSSSSFVLFGVEVSSEDVSRLAYEVLKADMIEKYGSLDNVPEAKRSWDPEATWHEVKDNPEAMEDQCPHELADVVPGLTYADEYVGFMLGENPTWFRENPDKTYNDLVEEITAKLEAAGLKSDNVELEYVECEICC
jgi:hypothetical protein